jgi:hypothetical protein
LCEQLIKSQPITSPKVGNGKSFGVVAIDVAHHLPTDTCRNDHGLALVIEAWATLPEAVRAGIEAMVRAAAGKG